MTFFFFKELTFKSKLSLFLYLITTYVNSIELELYSLIHKLAN